MGGNFGEGDIIKARPRSEHRLFPGMPAGPNRAALMRNRIYKELCLPAFQIVWLVLCVAALSPVANSIEVAELYTAQVPLDPKKPEARDEAYREALNLVLARITGSIELSESPLLAELFPNAARYVLQYRPGDENTLYVSLDGAAIESVLRRAGQTVWSKDRPLTVAWLAVDWGQGEREIVGADDADRSPGTQRSIDRNRLLRERLQDAARQRGLPITFPLLDIEDLEAISFSDIWGGFDERVLAASGRYGANAVLVGRVRPAAAQPYRWTFHLGSEVREFTSEPTQLVNQLADMMVAEFAFAGNVPLETVTLTVSGIGSLAAYGAVQHIMEQLNPVESFAVDSVAGNRIRYTVQVYGGVERLRRALVLSGKLEPGSEIGRGIDASRLPQFDSLDFSYRP
jgi:hypothetical protein